jgi:tetratricopeptide (TPR) repeat protein
MNTNTTTGKPSPRLERLLRFAEQDPANLNLISDAASAAYEDGALDTAAGLIERHATQAPLPPRLTNLKGLIALGRNNFSEAVTAFQQLHDQGDNAPALRFNLAWSKAMTEAYQEALDLLDDETLPVSRSAPSLKIQMMHHLGLYDEALACGEKLAERFPDNEALMGSLATLALDAEQPELARLYAERAGQNPEGSAALGILALGDHDVGRSMALFDQAIAKQPGNPRAWVGKGLSLLISGDGVAGAEAIDRGAEIFDTHLGSWIASGWAHFVNGDYKKARASFERALAADPNFSESHGGLAVLDIMEGRLDDARRNSEIALRLDKKCFGGALAKSLMLERSGHPQMAQKVRDIALSTPIGPNGQTIAQALVGFNSGLRK